MKQMMKRTILATVTILATLPIVAGDAFAGGYYSHRSHFGGRQHRPSRVVVKKYYYERSVVRVVRPRPVYVTPVMVPTYPVYTAPVTVPAPVPVPVSYPSNDNQVLGAILGGVAGAVLGHQIGGGSGRVAATVAGSVIGVVLGGEVGRQLDERDRLILASRTQYTLEKMPSGHSVEWANPDTGSVGTVTAQPATRAADGRYCREFQQTVVIGGREQSAYGQACRQSDGSWKILQ